MHIKVLGPGCAKCAEAKALVDKVVQDGNIQATVEKVSDLKEIMALGVLSTPAIVIDGVVKCTGRVPAVSELLDWFASPAAKGEVEQATGKGCCCGGKC